jgi:hypothetical protein
MYQRARRLSELQSAPHELLELAELQREAYVVAMNALALLDPKSAWIIVPMTTDPVEEVCLCRTGTKGTHTMLTKPSTDQEETKAYPLYSRE